MEQPPIDNRTDFVAHPQIFVDKDGEKLVTIVKATFVREADGTLEVAPKPRRRKIRFADIFWGDPPEKSSILYPGDICLRKPGTDVIVVAKACPPGNVPVPTYDAAVRVGPLQKIVRVFGLRVWQSGGNGLSPPRPVGEVEMRWENAWGGFDDSDKQSAPLEEPRNPIGTGLTRSPEALTHLPAPSLEDPAQPIVSARSRPPPAGMSAIGRNFEPRRRHVGTYDARWLEERAPLAPLDQDDRMNLCAVPDLVATPPLRGGEEAAIVNLEPGGGSTAFLIPKVTIEIEFRCPDRAPEVIRPYLDTVLIDTLANPRKVDRPFTLEMVWRASVPAPPRLKDARVRVREVP